MFPASPHQPAQFIRCPSNFFIIESPPYVRFPRPLIIPASPIIIPPSQAAHCLFWHLFFHLFLLSINFYTIINKIFSLFFSLLFVLFQPHVAPRIDSKPLLLTSYPRGTVPMIRSLPARLLRRSFSRRPTGRVGPRAQPHSMTFGHCYLPHGGRLCSSLEQPQRARWRRFVVSPRAHH